MSRPATRRAASLGRLLTNGFVAFSLWVLSRALMALLWSNRETFIDHDVRYYFWQLDADIGFGDFAQELVRQSG